MSFKGGRAANMIIMEFIAYVDSFTGTTENEKYPGLHVGMLLVIVRACVKAMHKAFI